jgi:hypothetical protein
MPEFVTDGLPPRFVKRYVKAELPLEEGESIERQASDTFMMPQALALTNRRVVHLRPPMFKRDTRITSIPLQQIRNVSTSPDISARHWMSVVIGGFTPFVFFRLTRRIKIDYELPSGEMAHLLCDAKEPSSWVDSIMGLLPMEPTAPNPE